MSTVTSRITCRLLLTLLSRESYRRKDVTTQRPILLEAPRPAGVDSGCLKRIGLGHAVNALLTCVEKLILQSACSRKSLTCGESSWRNSSFRRFRLLPLPNLLHAEYSLLQPRACQNHHSYPLPPSISKSSHISVMLSHCKHVSSSSSPSSSSMRSIHSCRALSCQAKRKSGWRCRKGIAKWQVSFRFLKLSLPSRLVFCAVLAPTLKPNG